MEKKEEIYKGKAKTLYTTQDENLAICHFRDDATAFDGKKKATIADKGIINNKLSSVLFELLESRGIPTHFVKMLNEKEMLVKQAEIILVEVIARNVVAGSLSKRLGIPEGVQLKSPIVEFYFKNDALGDPFVNQEHIHILDLATDTEIKTMRELALKANDILADFFEQKGLILVDIKFEFGRHKGGIILADEISPDTCRLWDAKTKERLDKDRFRRDLGKVRESYQEILRRVVE